MEAGYDVVCIGGALTGSSVAYFLSQNPDFDGTVLVVEPDSTYDKASSTRSGNSIREQFSTPVNIRISQFGMDFITNFHTNVQVDGESPELNFRGTGYLFLASERGMGDLVRNHEVHEAEGVTARLLSPDQIAAAFPYMSVEGLAGASYGGLNEGSMDGWALLQGYRNRARHNGVDYVEDRVVGLEARNGRVLTVQLESGRTVACDHVVNAAGPRAKLITRMIGLDLPVEPRIRSTFVFDCRTPIEQNVPLTITPEGVYFRREQNHYMTAATPSNDVAVDLTDFTVRKDEFDQQIWPVLASRVPQFDRISIVSSWAGHYAYNVLDQNVVVGAAPNVENFYFANGFSGHGLQQSPAVGRGISELITYGTYTSIDMTELGFERVLRNEPFLESVVI